MKNLIDKYLDTALLIAFIILALIVGPHIIYNLITTSIKFFNHA